MIGKSKKQARDEDMREEQETPVIGENKRHTSDGQKQEKVMGKARERQMMGGSK